MSYETMTSATWPHRPSIVLNETPKSETILVVDDDADAREALSELCKLELRGRFRPKRSCRA
jgi:hypothetical protein